MSHETATRVPAPPLAPDFAVGAAACARGERVLHVPARAYLPTGRGNPRHRAFHGVGLRQKRRR